MIKLRSFSAFEPVGTMAVCSVKARRSCDASILQTWLDREQGIKERYRLREGWYEFRILAPLALIPKLKAWADGAEVEILNKL